MLRRFVGVAMLCTVSHALEAQQLRGMVRDSALATPIPGAVVSIVDSSGSVAGRTIADGSGRFCARGAAAGGAPPRDSHRLSTAGPRDAIAEDGIVPGRNMLRLHAGARRGTGPRDSELCPGSSDRGPAFQLWEQARAGLLAAVVAREANPAIATSLAFKRRLTERDEVVTSQETKTRHGWTTRFIASAPPGFFAAGLYDGRLHRPQSFFAPDADVLLDESFTVTHCSTCSGPTMATSGSGGPRLLTTAPASKNDSVVDVNGVIWMDRGLPASPCSLDFKVHRTGTGGDGIWRRRDADSAR